MRDNNSRTTGQELSRLYFANRRRSRYRTWAADVALWAFALGWVAGSLWVAGLFLSGVLG